MPVLMQRNYAVQKTLCALLVLSWVIPGAAFAAFNATVLSVSSGDTLTLRVDGRVLNVRNHTGYHVEIG